SQLVFSTGNGNAISIADADAGTNPVQETLTAANGTLTLGTTAGLNFSVGTGTNNSTMTFTGTVAAINTALQGLIYRPTTNFVGAASLTVNTNDQGFLGSGGAKSDNDVVTINVGAGSAFNFSSASYIVGESDGAVIVTVTRNGDLSTASSINYATSNGTATDRSDYGAAFGTLQFAAGQFSTTFPVLINEDSLVEGNESFNLTLSNPQGTNVALGLQSTAVGTIVDNATEPATNAIDDSGKFVEQHYHDFLNRESDPAGFDFWVNNIESCGANAACREVRRIDTSAAFFLSIEFQQTGYFTYRSYTAAFGPNRIGSTVPLTLQEFLPDAQQIGRGVIIGNAGADALLESNKQAYVLQFVQRPAFTTLYSPATTPANFVDALNTNTGNSLTAAERNALVAQLTANNTSQGRANVLRAVVDNAAFQAREFNRAFVLMEYFGYLRRNPNDTPDPDFSGYTFWLNKLNTFNGNFRDAEMVKAFITSLEYRKRFGLD
ncbi:MAG: Calx-beta domain-containing protein, partial [Pyrinomonadaceae bacterium]